MKQQGFRQSMTWLHTWSGLVLCWIMYFMFVTGTLGYFDVEIDRWMQPELPVNQDIPLTQSLTVAQDYLEEHGAGMETWFIGPVKDRRLHLFASWRGTVTKDGEDEQVNDHVELDANNGDVIDESIRATGGGQLLYRMHYLLHYIDRDIIYPIIGVITFIMFIGITSGIVVHRKIFVELFTFRANKGARSGLDIHNLLSVSSLPFQVMISYSGLIFMLTTFFPLVVLGSYGFDFERSQQELSKLLGVTEYEQANIATPLVPFEVIGSQLDAKIEPEAVRGVQVQHPGDANARVLVTVTNSIANRGGEQWVFDGVSGDLLERETIGGSAGVGFATLLLGLHEGLFAGPFLRWLYFLAGLAGSAMIASGAIYWVRKRRVQIDSGKEVKGFKLVDNLNIGTIVGLLTAIAAYFWANRLLPLDMTGRADWEAHCMFLVWGLCLLHPFLRGDSNRAWVEQCMVASVAYLALPLVNAATTDTHLGNSLAASDWVLAGFDLLSIFTGLILACCGTYLWRRGQHRSHQTLAAPAATASAGKI